MTFNYVSINLPNSEDLRAKVLTLIECTRQLMKDLEAFSFGFDTDRLEITLDDLNSAPGKYASLVATHVKYYGRPLGCLTWKYDFKLEQRYIISLQEYDKFFDNWAEDVGYCSRPAIEVPLRHILAGRFLLPIF